MLKKIRDSTHLTSNSIVALKAPKRKFNDKRSKNCSFSESHHTRRAFNKLFIFYKQISKFAMVGALKETKVVSSFDFKAILKQLLETDQESFHVAVPYGLQAKYKLKVPKPIRVSLHSTISGVDSFVLHYGTGGCHRLAAWMEEDLHPRPRKTLTDKWIDFRISHLIYLPSSFIYVAACADMTIRTFKGNFSPLASIELLSTVLDMIYCDFLDVIIVSGIGFINVIELGQYVKDSPKICTSIKLTSISCGKPWISRLRLDGKNREILAICSEAVFFITGSNVSELHSNRILENRQLQSFTDAIMFPQQHYIITGIRKRVFFLALNRRHLIHKRI